MDIRSRDKGQISIGGFQVYVFPKNQWRSALYKHLLGVWANREKIMCQPEILFHGYARLYLERHTMEYFADSLQALAEHTENPPEFPHEQILYVANSRMEVLDSLIRFAKDPQVQMVIIRLPEGMRFYLWKRNQKGKEVGVLVCKADHLNDPD